MTQPLLLSIQVSLPRTITDDAFGLGRPRTWTTGIFKTPVDGPVMLGKLNLAGDGQADLSVHGGEDKAVMAYSADHYAYWRETFPDWAYGAFGENFTIAGMTEDNVCIDDVYEIGAAVVRVSQPRQPCWKLARKLAAKDLPARVIETGYSGWYFSVLQEGPVERGQPFIRVARPEPTWTIRRLNEQIYKTM